MSRTAFVTGAAGFVGRHLVDSLLAHGWEVTAFCRKGDPGELLPPEVRITWGDLTEIGSLRAAVPDGVDTLFHLAGNTSTWRAHAEQQWRDNVEGTRNVLDTALERRVRRFVDTSSVSSYGWQPGVVLDERSASNVARKGDPYGRSKRAAEDLVHRAAREQGLSAVVLNPVNVVGALDASNWSRQLILPISTGSLTVVPPGSATWISVHDLVDAEIAAAGSALTGNAILGGPRASFLEVVNTIERLLGRPVSPRATPRALVALGFAVTQGVAAATRREPQLSLAKYRRAIGDLRVDDSLAVRELGLAHTPVETMLAETIDWLERTGMLATAGVDRVAR